MNYRQVKPAIIYFKLYFCICREDTDLQNLIDLVQQDWECCGIGLGTQAGLKDWNYNEYFNCTGCRDYPRQVPNNASAS